MGFTAGGCRFERRAAVGATDDVVVVRYNSSCPFLIDATLQRDKSLKLRLYAATNIAIYWIMNLPEQQLEV